jgi:hypothetical protein
MATTINVEEFQRLVENVSKDGDSLFVGNSDKLEVLMTHFGMQKPESSDSIEQFAYQRLLESER